MNIYHTEMDTIVLHWFWYKYVNILQLALGISRLDKHRPEDEA